MSKNLSDIYKHITGNELKGGENKVGLCPFHNDSTPSFCVNDSKGVYICYACGAKGNTINFYSGIKKTSISDTINILHRNYGIDFTNDIRYMMASLPDKISSKHTKQYEWWRTRTSPSGMRFASKNLLSKIDNAYARQILSEIEKFGSMFDGVFALYFGISGGALNMVYARLFNDKIKYIQLMNNGQLYGDYDDVCYVVEGFSDCDAVMSKGIKCVAMNGLNNKFFGLRHATLWVDGDDAGKNFLNKIIDEEFSCIVDVIWTEGKDPNDYLMNNDLPKSVSYIEWYLQHNSISSYMLNRVIIKQPNLCNFSIMDEKFCIKYGINPNVIESHIDARNLRNRKLSLQLLNSDYKDRLPYGFFGFKDIDECYGMLRNNDADAFIRFPHLISKQTLTTDSVLNTLRRLYSTRLLKNNLNNLMYGKISISDVIPNYNITNKSTLYEAFKSNITKIEPYIEFPLQQMKSYGGLYPGKLCMIGGITGSNKTTLCINLIHKLMTKQVRTIYFNGEMLEHEIVSRLLSILLNKDIGDINDSDIENNKEYLNRLHIDNNLSFDNVSNSMVGYDVVFIDYVQRVHGNQSSPKYEFLTHVSSELKRLSVSHGISVVIVAQYNTSQQQSPNRYEQLAGSKAMMNDVDISMYIERCRNNERNIHINKCRYAPDGVVIHTRLNNQLVFEDNHENSRMDYKPSYLSTDIRSNGWKKA